MLWISFVRSRILFSHSSSLSALEVCFSKKFLMVSDHIWMACTFNRVRPVIAHFTDQYIFFIWPRFKHLYKHFIINIFLLVRLEWVYLLMLNDIWFNRSLSEVKRAVIQKYILINNLTFLLITGKQVIKPNTLHMFRPFGVDISNLVGNIQITAFWIHFASSPTSGLFFTGLLTPLIFPRSTYLNSQETQFFCLEACVQL